MTWWETDALAAGGQLYRMIPAPTSVDGKLVVINLQSLWENWPVGLVEECWLPSPNSSFRVQPEVQVPQHG